MLKGATTDTLKAMVGYEYCNMLFAMERKYTDYPSWQRELARQAFEEPLLNAWWLWVEKLDPQEGSKLEEAVVYARKQKAQLNGS